jgi:hypothetical protein
MQLVLHTIYMHACTYTCSQLDSWMYITPFTLHATRYTCNATGHATQQLLPYVYAQSTFSQINLSNRWFLSLSQATRIYEAKLAELTRVSTIYTHLNAKFARTKMQAVERLVDGWCLVIVFYLWLQSVPR